MLNFFNLFSAASHSRPHLTHCISVRWKRRPRKPIWMGMAKSKMFKIPVKKGLPEAEKVELKRLHYAYNRQLLSLKQFMDTDESNNVNVGDTSKVIQEKKEKSKALIDEWNAQSALLRKERLEREKLQQEEAVLERLFKESEKIKYIEAKVDEIVTAELVASSTFVTKENLDRILDECFNNVQDYNYALDLKGNIYKGKSNIPVGTLSEANVNKMESDIKTSESRNQ